MVEARKKANVIENGKDKAYAYDRDVRPYLEDIRDHIDKLELMLKMNCGRCQNTVNCF
jgi:glutamine synthetase